MNTWPASARGRAQGCPGSCLTLQLLAPKGKDRVPLVATPLRPARGRCPPADLHMSSRPSLGSTDTLAGPRY